MRKGKNSSCLCIHCEGTNAARRGSKAAINLITVVTSDNDTPILCLPTTPTITSPSAETEDPIDEVEDSATVTIVEDSVTVIEVDESTTTETPEPTQPTADDVEADKIANSQLLQLYNVLNMNTKYDMCVACLPCLENGKLEDAKIECIEGTCTKCGFDKLWSKGVRARIFDSDNKLNAKSTLATDVWNETVEWRAYEYKEQPTLASHAKKLHDKRHQLVLQNKMTSTMILQRARQQGT